MIQAMLSATVPLDVQTVAERRQLLAGYLDLVVHAVDGDTGPRDAYLEAVVSGIKEYGMPFDYVLAQMVGVAMAVASIVRAEHLAWHVAFNRDYVARLVKEWEHP